MPLMKIRGFFSFNEYCEYCDDQADKDKLLQIKKHDVMIFSHERYVCKNRQKIERKKNMDKRTLSKGWCTIVFVHILFVLIGILPVVNYLKETTLYGFIINWAYQILLIVFIIVCLKDFLVDSWKRFVSVGIKKNIKTIVLCFFCLRWN